MNEVDEHFLSFTSLLNDKIFKLNENKDLKVNKIKIGRKIPENTEKFYEFGTENMEITSPQLFRVMIKWIEEMESLLNKPSDLISKRSSIKYIKKFMNNIPVFDEIQSRRF